jgi:hypothetical protein
VCAPVPRVPARHSVMCSACMPGIPARVLWNGSTSSSVTSPRYVVPLMSTPGIEPKAFWTWAKSAAMRASGP